MADTDLTPEELAADTRLPLYNDGAYDPVTNPRGFDEDGHTVNQMLQANDVAVIGRMARRMALSASADVILTHADRALTAEDASNTYQDRLATAANLIVSAGHVSKAAQWASAPEDTAVDSGFSALHWASKAAAAAAGVTLPVPTSSDGLKFLQLKSDRTGYQLATIQTATATQVNNGTGTGFVTPANLGPAIDFKPHAGELIRTFGTPPGSNWLLCNGAVYSKSAHPNLFAVIGQDYADFIALANGKNNNPAGGLTINNNPTFKSVNGRVYLFAAAYASTTDKLFVSADDGANFTTVAGTAFGRQSLSDGFFFKSQYVFLPNAWWDGSYEGHQMFSANGLSGFGSLISPQVSGSKVYIADNNYIHAFTPGSVSYYRSGNPGEQFTVATNLPTAMSFVANNPTTNKIICIANSAAPATMSFSSNSGNTWSTVSPGSVLESYQNETTNGIVCGNGIWFIWGANNSIQSLWRSDDDGITFKLVRRTNADTDFNQGPHSIGRILFDGNRFIVTDSGYRTYSTKDGVSYHRLNPLTFYSVTMSDALVQNGLLIGLNTGSLAPQQSGIRRFRYAINPATEFQVPNLRYNLEKAYIRGT